MKFSLMFFSLKRGTDSYAQPSTSYISHEGIKSAGRSRIFLEVVLEDLAVNRLVPKLKLACANIQFSPRP